MNLFKPFKNLKGTFRMRNFLKGYGSILQIVPQNRFPRVESSGFIKNDSDALRSDWEAVGKDISKAIGIVSNERRK